MRISWAPASLRTSIGMIYSKAKSGLLFIEYIKRKILKARGRADQGLAGATAGLARLKWIMSLETVTGRSSETRANQSTASGGNFAS